MRTSLPALADPLPPEISSPGGPAAGTAAIDRTGLSAFDYALIERCMQIPAAIWINAAEAEQKASLVHYKVAGICMTLAGYAAGGWSRRPSVKQAKPALEAVDKVREAGLQPQEPLSTAS